MDIGLSPKNFFFIVQQFFYHFTGFPGDHTNMLVVPDTIIIYLFIF